MKRYNFYLITLILLLIITLLFSVPINAEEVDYNELVAVTVDEEMTTFNVLGMQTKTWQDYIEAYNNYYSSCPFTVIDNYVMYNNQFLIEPRSNNSIVNPTDTIVVAAGGVYGILPLEEIYTVGETSITISVLFQDISFNYFINNYLAGYDTLFHYYGTVESGYSVAYGDYELCLDTKPVYITNTIDSYASYDLVPIECEHIMNYVETKEFPTCVKTGIDLYRCLYCDYEEERETPVDEDRHPVENIVLISEKESTCTERGYVTNHCSLCLTTMTTYSAALGHDYEWITISTPTCTEIGESEKRCKNCDFVGKYTSDALGHDFCQLTCLQAKTCKTCGFVEEEALGHDYVSYNVLGWTICTRCNNLCKLETTISDNMQSDTTEHSFNDEFKEFVSNTEALLSLVMGFCVFILIFMGIRKLISAINLKNNNRK